MLNLKSKTNILCVLAIFTFLVLGCGGGGASNSSKSSAPAVDTANAIKVTATQLVSEYKTNEVAADGKYSGKTLEVSGKVGNIAKTMGNVTVSLKGGGDFELVSVMCNFDSEEGVASLAKGKDATLVGIGDGMTGGLYVGLKSCKVK